MTLKIAGETFHELMSRQRWPWVAAFAGGVLIVIVGARYADSVHAFGIDVSALLESVIWVFSNVFAPLAGALGIAAALKKPSKSAFFKIINSPRARWPILIALYGAGGLFIVLGLRSKPVPTWSCTIEKKWLAPANHTQCGDGNFAQMRTFSLELTRAGDAKQSSSLRANVHDRATTSVDLEPLRPECSSSGPDSPQPGMSRLDLAAECGVDGAFPIDLRICDAARISGGDSAAEITDAIELLIDDEQQQQRLSCTGANGSYTPAPPDAGVVVDGSPVADAGPTDAASPAAPVCPRWTIANPTGRGWLYARLKVLGGPMLTEANFVQVTVRSFSAAPPGEPASDDPPCAVGSYDLSAATVIVRGSAPGFITQERNWSPVECNADRPCVVELPKNLDDHYYVATGNDIRLKTMTDLPAGEQPKFAAAIGRDALTRAKALGAPLATTLQQAELVTKVPARDLARRYTEATLNVQRCDEKCLDSPNLDPEMSRFLKGLRKPGHPNPFDDR